MTQAGTLQKEVPERAAAPHVVHEPTHEEIQRRAYQIYLERGESDGSDLENWLLAENELKSNGQQN
jgi:hypothetical protein